MNQDWMTRQLRLPLWVSVDNVVIGITLIVTVSAVASFLSQFLTAELKLVSWFTSAAISLAPLRMNHYYKTNTGREQKRWALMGLILSLVCSFVLISRHYLHQGADSVSSLPLATLFSVGGTLVSYLRGAQSVGNPYRAIGWGRRMSRADWSSLSPSCGTR